MTEGKRGGGETSIGPLDKLRKIKENEAILEHGDSVLVEIGRAAGYMQTIENLTRLYEALFDQDVKKAVGSLTRYASEGLQSKIETSINEIKATLDEGNNPETLGIRINAILNEALEIIPGFLLEAMTDDRDPLDQNAMKGKPTQITGKMLREIHDTRSRKALETERTDVISWLRIIEGRFVRLNRKLDLIEVGGEKFKRIRPILNEITEKLNQLEDGLIDEGFLRAALDDFEKIQESQTY